MAVQYFEAVTDFHDSLEELNQLIKIANGYKKLGKLEKRDLMLRSTVLFLGTHLECLFETIAEEYIFKIEQAGLPRDKVPEALLMSSVHYHFNEELVQKVKAKNPLCKDPLINLAKILSCDSPVNDLKIDTSFSYGKHGSAVVEKLFKRLDIEDLFSNCLVTISRDSMLQEEPEVTVVDIKGKFNALTGARNALIHQYSMPNERTIGRIIQDIPLYKQFADSLAELLHQRLENILNQAA